MSIESIKIKFSLILAIIYTNKLALTTFTLDSIKKT